MSKPRAYLAYGLKKIWTLFALLLVLAAVALSLLRLSLPYLDGNKHLVEDYISSHYAADLKIGAISATWSRVGPSLVLNDVTLRDTGNDAIELSIERVFVEVDFWRSLQDMTLHSEQFELNRANFVVNTQFANASNNEANVVNMISTLFLERLQRFSVTDSQLTVNTQHNSQTYILQDVSWLNQRDRHQAVGQLRIAELANNTASFLLDLTGSADRLSGTLYAQGSSLDLSPWFNEFTTEQQTLRESRGNFTVWASFRDSSLSHMQASIQPSQFEWQSDSTRVLTEIKGGDIVIEPSPRGWVFNINDLVLSANQQQLHADFRGRIDERGNVLVETGQPITLAPLVALAPLFMEPEQVSIVEDISPSGQMLSLTAQIRQGGVAVKADLSDLSWRTLNTLPGLQGLDSTVYWYKNQGQMVLRASDTTLGAKGLLDEDLAVESFNASVYLYPYTDGGSTDWIVFSDDMQFVSDKVSFAHQMRLNLTQQSMQLATQIDRLPVADVPALFPENYMGEETKAYLTRALGEQPSDAAQVTRAKLLWQGPVEQFPFERNEGVFQALVNIRSAQFVFSPEWPALDELNIDLLFENDALTMRSAATRLRNVKLTDLVATIPSLSDGEVLQISASGSATGAEVAGLMNASQMRESLGNLLTNEVIVNGQLNTELALTIPLGDGEVLASGVVALDNNRVDISALTLPLTKVRGKVSFVNDSVTINTIKAELFSQPVTVAMQGDSETSDYVAHIDVKGQWDVGKLLDDYYPSMRGYARGQTDMQTVVDLRLGDDSFDYTAALSASLRDTELSLPAPFTSPKGESIPLHITSQGNNQASVIEAMLADEVTFNGVLPHAEAHFSRAHLTIGENPLTNLGVGFSISAALPTISVEPWLDLVAAISDNLQTSEEALFTLPERVFITADTLTLAGNQIENANVVGKYRQGNWDVDISSQQVKANVYVHQDWRVRGVDIQADFVRLDTFSEDAGAGRNARADAMPPLRFRCEQCKVGEIDLGAVIVDGVPSEQGYEFERIAIDNGLGEINAEGVWRMSERGTSTSFSGRLQSGDIGQLLKQSGFDTGIKDSEADLEFLLTWPDSPWSIDFASLDGEVDWSLTDGYITEVSDKGSRIFTLFSFNSLIRKLSLDFRDVFAQGFFYDDIEGSLQIDKGRAATQDTVVDGGAGEITINGYTDLATNQINYQFSFTPNVTGNLPVLMYFMVNPPTALAALALDRVLTSAKVISNINYSVTGTLDAPVFNEVGRDSTEVEIPARLNTDEAVIEPGSETSFVAPEPVSVRTEVDYD
ncbi:YhdP family protein [Alteromonas oceanisediminis]|uniref:YhdP family protein n=1 Tax=Alteromonas oceanisediminis TaxID=2836180 RepID=UPI001BDB6678|nr:YhdP family protein [Alteromonas oceanisediminis]MBT0586886.1 TIGR02099 family protein [Alteromonas oceanisediminis]